MKYIWYCGEKWEFVKWLCRAKQDRWILVKRKDGYVSDSGHECYEWATIDCGNKEWLWSDKKNDRLYNALIRAEKIVGELNNEISDRWCETEQ